MYTNVSQDFKNIVKSNVISATAKIILTNNNQELDSNVLKELTITDNCYNDGMLVGTAMCKEVEISIINKTNLDLANKEFALYIGVIKDDLSTEFVPYGNFKVKDYEDTKSNNIFNLIAYDYMDKLNDEYTDNNVYPTTLKAFYYNLCDSYSIQHENQTLPNENFIIQDPPEFDGMTARTVLSKCAELFGCFAKINRTNKMQMYLKTTTNEVIDGDSMNSKLEIGEKYGPINVVSLQLKNVEGENVTMQDAGSIALNGETTLIITDNPFVYTEALREDAITALFNQVNGFYYFPTIFNYKARMYIDCGDSISIEDVSNNTYVDSIMLNQTIKIPATRKSSCENSALTKTEIANKYISQSKQQNTHTELVVDKANQRITAIVSQIGDRSQKTTTLTEDIDGLKADVEQIAVLTKTVEGFGKIKLDNTSLTEIQEFKITGNVIIPTLSDDEYGTYGTTPMETLAPMSNLAPTKPHKKSEALYFSDETLLKDLTLIHIKSDNTIEKIQLPDFILRTYYDTKDEFVILDGNSKLIQRVGVDDAGFLYSLKEPIITELGETHLLLTGGDETFYLEGFGDVNFSATYMIKNDLMNSFATKVELKGSLELTSQMFNVELSKKVDNEELTGANIALRLNEDDSEATIKADKISLEGTVTANENFKVLEDGSIEAKNGSFSGDIYLADGSNIVGGKGLYSNLQFISSNQFEKIGYQADEMNARNLKQSIKIQCDIPENFTIEKAFITLFHRPIALGHINDIVDYGYARNIRLYTNENYEYSVSTEYYGSEFWEEEAYYLQEIIGAFGSNGYTPSVPSASSLKLETKTTTDISGHLKTGLNEFVIQTANSIPSYIDGGLDLGYPNWLNVMKQTGGARAILFVYGYMKVK